MAHRWLLALGLVLACSDDDSAAPDAGPLAPTSQLDVLFVIDDSGTMLEEQRFVAEQMQAFAARLTERLPADRSLHLGVISTSVSIATPILGANCLDAPDGRLLALPGCLDEGQFLVDEPGAGGERTTNYPNSLGEAASCMVQLGTAGCGFEQPLQSLSLALHAGHAENAGFLRPGAALLVVLLGDEDDCSAHDQDFFDPTGASLASELGPMESYRCTEFGLECAEGTPGRTDAVFTECRAQAGSPYLYHPSHFRDELVALKGDARRIAVMTVAANPEPVQVELDGSVMWLLPSCSLGLDRWGLPAVRLVEFARQFSRNAFVSFCEETNDQLAEAADLAASAMGHQP